MKRLSAGLVFALLCALSIFAQNKVIAVSGRVIESDTKQPAAQATIQLLSLPDSTYATGMASSNQGWFTLPKVNAGKYLLKVSYIGFRTTFVPVALAAGSTAKNMGEILLEPDAVMLEEAVIVAAAPPVTVKEDTTEYSAAAYPVPEGSMLEDLVKKIPGAEVTEDGKITINGKEIKKIMVDGKEFFSDDPKVSMKNLPASMIEKVKAYDKKSDMARITGIDDGEEEAVLDLSVKKGMKQGWLGNLIAGYGSQDRYEAGVMVSRFKDDASISIIGSANNTNNQGFSEFGDAGSGMGGDTGSGITTAQSLGVNFAKDTEKLELGGNVQYGHTNNDRLRKTSSENFEDGTSSYGQSENLSNRNRHDFRVDFRMEWRPDTLTTIIFRPNASYSQTESSNSSTSDTQNDLHAPVNSMQDASSSKSKNWSFNGSLQAFRRLNNEGRNVSVGARFGYSDNVTDSYSDSYSEFFLKNDSISDISRYTDGNRDSRNWSVSASYTEPVFKNHFLQLRYEFAHRKQLSQSLVYDSINVYPYPEYMERGYANDLSSRVENFYDTHTADVSIRGIHPKMMYSLGVGLTPQASLSKTTIGPNYKKNLPEQKVLNWAPSVMFRYMFNKQHVLMFRYRGRSSVPNIEDLQEVIDISNPMNLRYGNPNLKPSFNNNFTLYYNRFIPESMRSYSANVYYTNTLNSVVNRMTYDKETGARISNRENVNGNWQTSGFFSFNTPLRNQKFTISSNTNIRYSDAVSYANDSLRNPILSTTHNLRLGERLTGSYRSEVFDFSLIGSVNYNLAKNSLQPNSNRETFDYNLGANTIINLPWDISISSDVNYLYRTGYTGGFDNNEVMWNAQISKNFLKNKAGTIRFKMYDILKQQSNLSRSISAEAISDTESNILGSYFMVHFVYRFNTLGGGASSQGNNRSGGGRGGRGGYGGGRHF